MGWDGFVLFTFLVGALLGCGGVSQNSGANPGNTAGSSGLPSGGAASPSAGSPASPQAGGAGEIAGASSAGNGNANDAENAGAGSADHGDTIPGESAREAELIAPLSIDDATIEQATGEALVQLARSIGAARGYIVCRCWTSPTRTPADVESIATSCGEAESAVRPVSNDDRARCITDRMSEVAGFEDYLRCSSRNARSEGLARESVCWGSGSDTNPMFPSEECTEPPGANQLIQECYNTIYCPDGSSARGNRCDGEANCADFSDEYDCFDKYGFDEFVCDNTVHSRADFCLLDFTDTSCSVKTNPTCQTTVGDFPCGDGSYVSSSLLCNRVKDCASGRDESICLR